jgi:hypothetical protein
VKRDLLGVMPALAIRTYSVGVSVYPQRQMGSDSCEDGGMALVSCIGGLRVAVAWTLLRGSG